MPNPMKSARSMPPRDKLGRFLSTKSYDGRCPLCSRRRRDNVEMAAWIALIVFVAVALGVFIWSRDGAFEVMLGG